MLRKVKRNPLPFMIVFLILVWICLMVVLPGRMTEAQTPENPLTSIARATGFADYTGFQALSPNSTTASSLTVPANARKAFMTLETASIRYRLDGTAPTTTVGHLLTAGQSLTLDHYAQLTKFQAISVSTHGALKISYGQ